MFLKPEEMKRVRIIGSNLRKSEIISSLHDAGVIQLEPVSPDITKEVGMAKPGDLYRKVNSYLQKYRGYESILPHRPVEGLKSFRDIDELLSEASSIEIENELKSLKSMESDTLAEIKEIKSRLETVESLTGLDYDLSIFNGSAISSFIVKGADPSEAKSLIAGKIPEATVFTLKNQAVVVTIPVAKDAELARAASELKLTISHIPEMSGKPSEYRQSLEKRMVEKNEAIAKINSELASISGKYYERIAQIREQLEIENKKLEVSEKLFSTQDSFVMEGWIPAKHFGSLVKMVEDAARGSVIIKTIKTDEEPPTMLNNPKRFKTFEFFIRFYSLPQEFEFDPTFIFGIIFPVFFGIMVGDWAYGLIILGLAIWMVRKLSNPHAKTILPKKLTRFAITILGRGPLLVLGKTLIPASIVSIIVGLLFNNFFGFPLLPVTVFEASPGFSGYQIFGFPPNPVVLFHLTVTIPKLLLLTGYMGLAMVSFGLILGFLNESYLGHKKGMAAKIGWLLMAWGVAIFGLNLIHLHKLVIIGNTTATLSLATFLAGLITVIFSEGGRGAIEIPSIISHILSYTRILGILLASVYLAHVINLIFLRGVLKSPEFAVIGVFVLVLGQLFNLAIAIFEPGIQGARLLYVEFFSKFYHGNGRNFRPFETKRKYTAPRFTLQAAEKGKN